METSLFVVLEMGPESGHKKEGTGCNHTVIIKLSVFVCAVRLDFVIQATQHEDKDFSRGTG